MRHPHLLGDLAERRRLVLELKPDDGLEHPMLVAVEVAWLSATYVLAAVAAPYPV